ncbi:MAG: hypothetical protein J6Q15_00330, partial [Clostridia bacterium]|nr:hypothetical protein [Clostridia bacterium]
LVADRYKCKDGYVLGKKVSYIRHRKELLDEKLIEILDGDNIKFIWNVLEYKFEEFCNHLLEYKAQNNGSIKMPSNYICEDGYKLHQTMYSIIRGDWKLTPNMIRRLYKMGIALNDKGKKKFEGIIDFKELSA